MPVSTETNNTTLTRITLDPSIFEEVTQLLDRIKSCEDSEKEDKKKVAKLTGMIESASETIARAEEKRNLLLTRNKFLKNSLESSKQRQIEALEYWKNYGFDAKQISTDKDDYEQYEFIFSNLPHRKEQNDNFECSIEIKFNENKLQVVSQRPELFNTQQLDELHQRLNDNCISTNGTVNYRSAMVMIRKAIVTHSSADPSQQSQSPPPDEPKELPHESEAEQER